MPPPQIQFILLAATVGTVLTDSALRIDCGPWGETCQCSEGAKCASDSLVPGVRDRYDSYHCCCPGDAPLIWSDPMAKCSEASKCVWNCCGNGQKLCGDTCCQPPQKCLNGTCSSAPGLVLDTIEMPLLNGSTGFHI
mmetsp:Transcript_860/g.901  ORF Transcript_860/g.901 Transcript_860/m.901 type:complete len:137 (-) Transcript_860:145-555(-)